MLPSSAKHPFSASSLMKLQEDLWAFCSPRVTIPFRGVSRLEVVPRLTSDYVNILSLASINLFLRGKCGATRKYSSKESVIEEASKVPGRVLSLAGWLRRRGKGGGRRGRNGESTRIMNLTQLFKGDCNCNKC